MWILARMDEGFGMWMNVDVGLCGWVCVCILVCVDEEFGMWMSVDVGVC